LKSLLAFEAAARHLSLSRAAEELCVVPAAISHHIRTLEQWLGVPLFRHENRALVLTDSGRAYVSDLKILFDGLSDATNAVLSCSGKDRLVVTAPPSFTTKCLLPRLHRFRELCPDIDLNLAVSASLTDCVHESTDVGIHYSKGDYPDVHSVKLDHVELFPVCRPVILLDGREPPTRLDQLSEYTLLHDDMLRVNERKDWRYWLESAGAPNSDIADHGLHFNQAAMTYQAAIDGHGIALAKSTLIKLDLLNGRLMRPFAHACPTDHFYFLLCRSSKKENSKVAAFRDWILAELGNAPTADEPAAVETIATPPGRPPQIVRAKSRRATVD
jgi:LysR family glycine cleavage system transcriptional activator